MSDDGFGFYCGQASDSDTEAPAVTAAPVVDADQPVEVPADSRPSADSGFNMGGMARQGSNDAWRWLGGCVLLLGAAFVFTACYKTNR